jgi:hypothetical protein
MVNIEAVIIKTDLLFSGTLASRQGFFLRSSLY